MVSFDVDQSMNHEEINAADDEEEVAEGQVIIQTLFSPATILEFAFLNEIIIISYVRTTRGVR